MRTKPRVRPLGRVPLAWFALLLPVLVLAARDVHRGMQADPAPPTASAQTTPEATVDPDWADCLACHDDPTAGLPPLAELRVLGVGAHLPDCAACHDTLELTGSRREWWHPVRSVAAHLACRECHPAVPHGAADLPPGPGISYREERCFECHAEIEFKLSLMFNHRSGAAIRCRDCHPPHEPLQAALPAQLVPTEYGQYWQGNCDWWLSNLACLRCHPAGTLLFGLTDGFVTLNTVNYHELHVTRGEVLCVECHDPHGGSNEAMVRDELLNGRYLSYFASFDGGTCSVICHGVNHESWQYINEVF